ncbi:hypothetical protein [Desulfatirhabdium butyrativorans]|uniref:hypothetical protein n=1 Tax=Desulfatirhabdium butyrativorans TaxID=340467 RepID=UPI000483E57F|nr:hypothetical protein [Desulfatirhabdium butyrativorans]
MRIRITNNHADNRIVKAPGGRMIRLPAFGQEEIAVHAAMVEIFQREMASRDTGICIDILVPPGNQVRPQQEALTPDKPDTDPAFDVGHPEQTQSDERQEMLAVSKGTVMAETTAATKPATKKRGRKKK